MRWRCSQCRRAISLAFSECPFCRRAEAAASGSNARDTTPPQLAAATRAPSLTLSDSALARGFRFGLGLALGLALVLLVLASLWLWITRNQP